MLEYTDEELENLNDEIREEQLADYYNLISE
jgi:hypothetical protein